uniref:Uncharacterized protein n=1 Tax=Romanomermis culicivorax TaxID=13658 RepID=A0A915KY44_ROMCU
MLGIGQVIHDVELLLPRQLASNFGGRVFPQWRNWWDRDGDFCSYMFEEFVQKCPKAGPASLDSSGWKVV